MSQEPLSHADICFIPPVSMAAAYVGTAKDKDVMTWKDNNWSALPPEAVTNTRELFSVVGGLTYDVVNGVFGTNDDYTKNLFRSTNSISFDETAGTFSVNSTYIKQLFSGSSGIIYNSVTGASTLDSTYLNNFFDFRLASKTTDNLTEGVTNKYMSVANLNNWLTTITTDNILQGMNNLYANDMNLNAWLLSKTSDDVAQGLTNLYATMDNLNSWIAVKSTDALHEGISNLYYTDTRVNSAFDTRLALKTSDNLSEGKTNLYASTTNLNTYLATKTTNDLAEGKNNLYYTDLRVNSAFDTRLALKTTDNLTQGLTNLYATADNLNNWLAVKSTDALTEGISNLYYTVTRVNSAFDTRLALKTTDNLTEGTNLYYTDLRVNTAFDSRLALKSTTNLAEGSNLYYTDLRVNSAFDTRLALKTTDNLAQGSTNLYATTDNLNNWLAFKSTDALTEGISNLYYTTTRVNSAFDTRLALKTTDNLTEGLTNIYYTSARANADFDTRLTLKTSDNLTQGLTNLYATSTNLNAYLATKTTDSLTQGTNNLYASVDNLNNWLNTKSTDALAEGISHLYYTDLRDTTNFNTNFATKYTDNLAEGLIHLYYTSTRANADFDTRLALKSTDDLIEGKTNLYFTDARANADFDTRLALKTSDNLAQGSTNLYATMDNLNSWIAVKSTDALAEGISNLYYTDTRVNAAFDIRLATKTSDNVAQGLTNLYATGSNLNMWLQTKTTDSLDEGLTNVYYTSARANADFDTRLALKTTDNLSQGLTNLYASTDNLNNWLAVKSTDALAEGLTNLYASTNNLNAYLATKTTDALAEGLTNLYASTDNLNNWLAVKSTDALAQGITNLYASTTNLNAYLATKTTDNLTEGKTNIYYTSTRANIDFDTRLALKTTDALAEGLTNLYASTTNLNTYLATKTTDNLTEGKTNIYYTSTRANIDFDTRLALKTTDNLSQGVTNLYASTTNLNTYLATKTTDNLTEGVTNVYFTNARAQAAVTIQGTSNRVTATTVSGTTTLTTPQDTHTGAIPQFSGLTLDNSGGTINFNSSAVNKGSLSIGSTGNTLLTATGTLGLTSVGTSSWTTNSSGSINSVIGSTTKLSVTQYGVGIGTSQTGGSGGTTYYGLDILDTGTTGLRINSSNIGASIINTTTGTSATLADSTYSGLFSYGLFKIITTADVAAEILNQTPVITNELTTLRLNRVISDYTVANMNTLDFSTTSGVTVYPQAKIIGITDNIGGHTTGSGALSFRTYQNSVMTESLRLTGGGNVVLSTVNASSILATDLSKNISTVTIGSNLSYSAGTLNTIVNPSFTSVVATTNITAGTAGTSSGELITVNGTASQSYIGFWNSSNCQGYLGTDASGAGMVLNADLTSLKFQTVSTAPIIFSPGAVELARMTTTGLGIGVTPSYKLDVSLAANKRLHMESMTTGAKLVSTNDTFTEQPITIQGSTCSFMTNGTDRISVANDGTVTAGTTTSQLVINGASASVSAQFTGTNSYAGVQIGAELTTTFTGNNGSYIEGILSSPTFAISSGRTIPVAAAVYNSPFFTGNAGTITNAVGYYYDGGGATVGTITNAYGLYVNNPAHGTNKYAAYFGGNVGIGTTAPTNLLTVGTVNSSSGELIKVNGTATQSYIGFWNSGASQGYIGTDASGAGLILNGSLTSLKLQTGSSIPIIFSPSSGEAMRILGGGNVGISNPSPSYKFTVGSDWGIDISNTYYVDIQQNLRYDGVLGWVNRTAGGCSYIQQGGGSSIAGFMNLYVGDTITSSPAGTVAGLKGISIIAGGNVGIGTITPSAFLDVQGTKSVIGDVYGMLLRPTLTTTATEYAGISTFYIAGTYTVNSTSTPSYPDYTCLTLSPSVVATTPIANLVSFKISSPPTSGISTITNLRSQYIIGYSGTVIPTNVYSLYVEAPTVGTNKYTAYFGGNVGIGTNTPQANLHVSATAYPSIRISDTTNTSDYLDLMRDHALNIAIIRSSTKICFEAPANYRRMTILPASGNVGIGTETPQAKLHVNGNILQEFTGTPWFGTRYYSTGADVDGNRYTLGLTYDTVNRTLNFDSTQPDGTGGFAWNTGGTQPDKATVMTLAKAGYLGIGTISPRNGFELAKLDSNYVTSLRIGGITSGTTGAALYGETSRHQIIFSSWRDNYPDTVGAKITAINTAQYVPNPYLVQYTDLVFYTLSSTPTSADSTTEKMRISAAGNVGIGTTDPKALLSLYSNSQLGYYFSPNSGLNDYATLQGQSVYKSGSNYIVKNDGSTTNRFAALEMGWGILRFLAYTGATTANVDTTLSQANFDTCEYFRVDYNGYTTCTRLANMTLGGGAYNIIIGTGALSAATASLYDNVAIGNNALHNNNSGLYNVAVGSGAILNGYHTTTDTCYYNTALGYCTLYLMTTGSYNTAAGYCALYSITTGVSNTAFGYCAGINLGSSSYQNVCLGTNALFGVANNVCSDNVALGVNTMYNMTTGVQNVAVGTSALYSNNAGINNTAVGYCALLLATHITGIDNYYNTAVGWKALGALTTGYSNTGLGHTTGYWMTTGTSNVFVGTDSGYNVAVDSTRNVAVGVAALYGSGSAGSNLGSAENVAIGFNAAYKTTSAIRNVAIGLYAGYEILSGGANVFVGSNCGRSCTTGTFNTCVGANIYLAAASSGNVLMNSSSDGGTMTSNYNNCIYINAGTGNTNPSATNQIILRSGGRGGFICDAIKNTQQAQYLEYNTSTNEITYYNSISSSAKYKENIRPAEQEFLNVFDSIDVKKFDYNEKAGEPYTNMADVYGMIAEEVEEVFPFACKYIEVDGKKELFTIKYEMMVIPLWHMVKQLKKEIANLHAKFTN